MAIFFTLLYKLIPLYALIILGYFAGKYLPIKKELIANILINYIVPIVIFTGILTTKINVSTLSIPLLFLIICIIVALITFYFSGFIWKDSNRNIISFTAASANTGYFGLPVAVALFGQEAIGIVSLALLGTTIYTNTLGYYLAAKGKYTAKESFIKVFKLPILYAFILGVITNLLGIHPWKIYFDTANIFNTLYIILGMMLIGISLAKLNRYTYDFKFVGITLVTKFILWPILMFTLLTADKYMFHFYNKNVYGVLLLMSIVPLAVNIVPYTTVLKSHPEKVALAVLVSTIFALLYIPLVSTFFLK